MSCAQARNGERAAGPGEHRVHNPVITQIYAKARTIIRCGLPQFLHVADAGNNNRLRLSHLQRGEVGKKSTANGSGRAELQATSSMHIILQTSSISSCKWHDSRKAHGCERHEPPHSLDLSFSLARTSVAVCVCVMHKCEMCFNSMICFSGKHGSVF